ncbi:MAG TPA: crotonase/enoyl-CoA hydratase family protein [Acidimicrobiales bacterium]|nr:crotonase/enoyl-CoA hydratase family protein [Acidimicrobiales bacterium]
MDFAEIAYEVSDGIATVTLDRPDKLNAGTSRMVRELLAAIDRIDGDDAVRAVVLTGRGRAFCAGADLSAGASTFDYDKQRADGGADLSEIDPARQELRQRDGAGLVTMRLFDCLKPVISAINGPAVGMGATMTLATDIRLASETARFGFVFTRRGIVPEGASSWFLPRLVGVSQAAEWLYTGRVFDAGEALAGGLVRSVHPGGELFEVAYALAAEIAEGAPVSVALTRRMLWRMLTADHPMAAHRVDSRAVRATGTLPDAAEGIQSFLEKRPARFTGRVSDGLPDVFPHWTDPTFS